MVSFAALTKGSLLPPASIKRRGRESKVMKWEQIARNWDRMKTLARERWGKLSDRDVELVEGDRAELAQTLMGRYKWPKERAEIEVQEWQESGTRPPSFNRPESLRKAG